MNYIIEAIIEDNEVVNCRFAAKYRGELPSVVHNDDGTYTVHFQMYIDIMDRKTFNQAQEMALSIMKDINHD